MRYTGYKDKHGTPIHEGDRIRWTGDGGEYIITFSQVDQEWILKDDRPDYACPSLEGISSPQMSRVEIIGKERIMSEQTVRPIGQQVYIRKSYMRKNKLGKIVKNESTYPDGKVEYLVEPIPFEDTRYYCFESELRGVRHEGD